MPSRRRRCLAINLEFAAVLALEAALGALAAPALAQADAPADEAASANQLADAKQAAEANQAADLNKPADADAKKQAAAKQADAEKKPAEVKPPADAAKTTPKKAEPPKPVFPPFERVPSTRPVALLTPDQFDALTRPLIAGQANDPSAEHDPSAEQLAADPPAIDDAAFLRRASLDLIGRQPTPDELRAFLADDAAARRQRAVERLLDSPEHARNWARYWRDVIAARQQEPELTFHNYQPFETWLAGELGRHGRWDEIVYQTLTAAGKVGADPAATFLAFHQGDRHRVAGETSRVFLGVQIACAECHDHPFLDMKQEVFHGVAAFFARAGAKVAQKNSNDIEVTSLDKGEHKIPGKPKDVAPTHLEGGGLAVGAGDVERRGTLARWITSGDNPWFAKAYVNRVWARLAGRGFCEPVDEIGQGATPILPELHAALADHFIASGHDTKALFRLIVNSRFYQRPAGEADPAGPAPLARAAVKKLRGDEVYDSLVAAIGLPNVDTPAVLYGASRFPPPPKTTRDLVNDAFGHDPSVSDPLLPRTLKQAMFLMNNDQVQKQINAAPGADTLLARLLASEPNDEKAAVRLFEAVLARQPTPKEQAIVAAHRAKAADRGAAFEDLLWSLLNSAEFTLKR